jgi:hypothetical protein
LRQTTAIPTSNPAPQLTVGSQVQAKRSDCALKKTAMLPNHVALTNLSDMGILKADSPRFHHKSFGAKYL